MVGEDSMLLVRKFKFLLEEPSGDSFSSLSNLIQESEGALVNCLFGKCVYKCLFLHFRAEARSEEPWMTFRGISLPLGEV